MKHELRGMQGFTLVEMIVVIVLTGILAGIVAVFVRAPVQGYVDSARRADLTDMADTALRRMARDLRTAVPNSVRVPIASGSTYLEFLPTSDGGRYRAHPEGGSGGCSTVTGNTAGDALSFGEVDTCFEVIGSPITFGAGDQIVLGSTQSDGSLPYGTSVRRSYSGVAGSTTLVQIASDSPLPAYAQLQGHRFEVVPGNEQAVTYACENVGVANGDGTGTLKRYWNYGILPVQPVPGAGSSALLAQNVSECNMVYDTFNQRNGLVAVVLGLMRNGERVNLYHEIHVHNLP